MTEKATITLQELEVLEQLLKCYTSLLELGWTEPRYFQFPEHGEFELIELGSTGIHRAVRSHGYCFVDGEWPSNPFLVRSIKQ